MEKLRKTMDEVEGDLWVASDSQRETMERLAAEEKLITNEVMLSRLPQPCSLECPCLRSCLPLFPSVSPYFVACC